MARFLDSSGFSWHVTELRPDTADQGGSLYFFSRGCTLRLERYPASWDELGWHELDALRARAEVLSTDVTRPGRGAQYLANEFGTIA